MNENQIPVIQKDAQIQLTFGTTFIKRMQEVMLSLVIDKTEEEMDLFAKELDEKKDSYSEEWMNHYMTMMIFLSSVDNAAQEQGFVDYIDAPSPQDS